MGQNSQGQTGLFPSNYVELVGEDEQSSAHAGAIDQRDPADAPLTETAPPAGPPGGTHKLPTATAEYDYEAAEENELSFPEGAKIENVEFPVSLHPDKI